MRRHSLPVAAHFSLQHLALNLFCMIARLVESLHALSDQPDAASIRAIAPDFADAYRLVCDCPQMLLTAEQERILTELDMLLESAFGAAEVRSAARRALRALGES